MPQPPDAAPDAIPHRLALWRLVKVAQAIVVSDGPTPDLERAWFDAPALAQAVSEAAAFAKGECRGCAREAWPLLAQACAVALRHIAFDTGSAAEREGIARWKAIVGALLPMVAADWQDWRDAVAPKVGSRGHG